MPFKIQIWKLCFSYVLGGRAKVSIHIRRSWDKYFLFLKALFKIQNKKKSISFSLMCKVVEPSSPSISEDAPKFLNQITSLHWKTNHTQRPFIEVTKVHFAELFFLCLWIMTKIQKALDTFLPHSVSGFFYHWCFFCLWCCSTFWPFYIPPRLWTSPRWTAWLMWISKKRAIFSKYPMVSNSLPDYLTIFHIFPQYHQNLRPP